MNERNLEALEREIAALAGQVERLEQQRRNAWHRRLMRGLTSATAHPRFRFGLTAAIVMIPLAALAVTVPNVFVNGQVADADEVNANFLALENGINDHEALLSAHHAKTTNASELTSGVLSDLRLSSNVSLLGGGISELELDFDPGTQAELDAHTATMNAHHVKTFDAGELFSGTLPDARLSANVSLLGSSIAAAELSFDPATQIELNGHVSAPSAHHFRYSDAEAIAAVGPHSTLPNRILVAPSGGDFTSIQAAIDSVNPTAGDPYLIEIASGTYAENLTLKSHLQLRGTSRTGTKIQPAGIGANHVTANALVGVELSRLALSDTGNDMERALDAVGSEIRMTDVIIEGYSTDFVRGTAGSRFRIESSELADPFGNGDDGIILIDSEASIHNTRFALLECAVEAERSSFELTGSEVEGGILCTLGNATPPAHAQIAHNRLDRIDLSGSGSATIMGNEIESATTVLAIKSGGATHVLGNRISGSGSTVVSVENAPGGSVEILGNEIAQTGPSGNAIFNAVAARIIGNTLSASNNAVVDLGTAVVTGNRILSGNLVPSSTTFAMGNLAAGAPSPESWIGVSGIRIESTADDVRLEAGGSTISLDASGDVTIQAAGALAISGQSVAINADGALALTGVNVTASASNELELNGGGEVDVNSTIINLN